MTREAVLTPAILTPCLLSIVSDRNILSSVELIALHAIDLDQPYEGRSREATYMFILIHIDRYCSRRTCAWQVPNSRSEGALDSRLCILAEHLATAFTMHAAASCY